MNDSECAKAVLDWAIREAMCSTVEQHKMMCEIQGNQKASETWKKLNPDDGVGGFGCNPYTRDTDYCIKRLQQLEKHNAEKQAILEFIKIKIRGLI